MSIFRGLSAFPLTPSSDDGQVDTEAFQRILARLVAAKVNSVSILGSTGTYAFLSLDERMLAAEAAMAEVGGEVPLIVGIGALRTDHAQELARHAAEIGADGLLMAPVSYNPLTDDEVFGHYAAVAEATGLPICIYNNPSTTHFSFGQPLLRRMADLPTITAIKMPLATGDALAAELVDLRATLPGRAVGYSGDWGCADALLAGANCWFSVIGGLLPLPALRLTRAAMGGDQAEVARLQALFQPLWTLFRQHGGLRVVHAAANLLDLTDRRLPLPLLPIPPADIATLKDALQRLQAD